MVKQSTIRKILRAIDKASGERKAQARAVLFRAAGSAWGIQFEDVQEIVRVLLA
jgi:endonuclease IV